MTDINESLKSFDATEANLGKLERIWRDVFDLIPAGVCFYDSFPEYDEKCRQFRELLKAMPAIDGYKLKDELMTLNEIAQARLDAQEIGEIDMHVGIEETVTAPEKSLAEYRFRFNRVRKELIRSMVRSLITEGDALIPKLKQLIPARNDIDWNKEIESEGLHELESIVNRLDVLFGSAIPKPPQWRDLRRHLHFSQLCDVRDVVQEDWNAVTSALDSLLYDETEPIPVGTADLSVLARQDQSGIVVSELNWNQLSAEAFERLVYNLISYAAEYSNPAWLTETKAPDRGRDLSALRISHDSLSESRSERVIIQCKHRSRVNVSLPDVTALKDQMSLWEPPPVNVLIIATSAKFTTNAIDYIEKHNFRGKRPRIEMWSVSHLEKLLHERPYLIAEYALR